MKNVITVRNLDKTFRVKARNSFLRSLINPQYRTVEAVKDINFNVEKGEAVAFLGPNGAGKTTTIKMMTGLIHPSNGSVRVLGSDPFLRDPNFLKRIGLVMGNKAALSWDLTANQSFKLIKNIYNLDEDFSSRRIAELSELLSVETLLDTQMRNLSLGERMKMELIGSILHNPEILFLDEPTIGLDILTKKKVRNFLKNIQKNENTTLILTSHDIDDIEAVCDRVIIINKGMKYYDDSIGTLIDKYQKNRYLRFVLENPLSPDQLEKVSEWATSEDTNDKNESDPAGAVYLFKTNMRDMIHLTNYILTEGSVIDMKIESVPLEDIIADLFRGN